MPEQFSPYHRNTFYYETDQMGIIHHANYIRWMEEARLTFLQQAGLPYENMERIGIIMPVTGVSCQYRHSVRFPETIRIVTRLVSFNGVRAAFRYEIFSGQEQSPAASAESSHCFVDRESRMPVNMNKIDSSFCRRCTDLLANP